MDSNDDIQVYVRKGQLSNRLKKRGCIAVAPVSTLETTKKKQEILTENKITIKDIIQVKLKPIANITVKIATVFLDTIQTGIKSAKPIQSDVLKQKGYKIKCYLAHAKQYIQTMLNIGHNLNKNPIVHDIKNSKAYLTVARYTKYRKLVAFTCGTISLVALLYFSGFSFGYDVYIDGKKVATVHSQVQFNEAIVKINNNIKEASGLDGDINPTSSLVLSLVQKNGFSSERYLADRLREFSKQLIDAYAVSVDGTIVVALKDEESASNVLKMLKNKYIGDKDGVVAEFVNAVDVNKQRVPVFLYASDELALSKLTGTEQVDGIHEVKGKDTLWGIARANDMTVKMLMELNPGITEVIRDGQKLNIKQPKPILSVKTIEKAVYEETTPCEVKKVDEPSLYKGKTDIYKTGKDGLSQIEAEIIKINGIETNRNIISSTTLINPVEKVILVGTKPIPKGIGTGNFARPYYGTITSRFGPRWGTRHTGVDLSGDVGDPIRVSDNGKVTYTGYDGGYGNLIVVNHNNGYETLYGHLSKFKVSVGDTVEKGDTIGLLGNTGFSTGPHLHFEVRKNGSPVNPLDFLK